MLLSPLLLAFQREQDPREGEWQERGRSKKARLSAVGGAEHPGMTEIGEGEGGV